MTPEKLDVGLVLGGFYTFYTLNEKLVPAAIVPDDTVVNVAFTVLVETILHVTAVIKV